MGLTPKQEPNWAMLRGKELEPVARDIYEFNYHISVPAKNFIHPDYKWAKASVDGWSDEHKFIVEFKAPGKKDLVLAQSGQMPDKYYPQVQWQMFVTNANFCDYVTYDGKADIYVKRVFSDKKYQRKLFLLARWFWAKVEAQSEIRREPRCLKKTI